MWSFVSKFLINLIIAIVSDKVVIEAGKKLITKGVDSAVKGVGISNEDAQDLITSIVKSSLNGYTGLIDETNR